MTLICGAVFENGVFRPTATLPQELAEGQQVHLVAADDSADVLALAADVYRGLTDGEINEVERIALDRRHFSERSPL